MNQDRPWTYAWERGTFPRKPCPWSIIEPKLFTPSRHARQQVWKIQNEAISLGWQLPELMSCESINGLNSLVMLTNEDQEIGEVTADGIELIWPDLPKYRPHIYRRWNAAKWASYDKLQRLLRSAA